MPSDPERADDGCGHYWPTWPQAPYGSWCRQCHDAAIARARSEGAAREREECAEIADQERDEYRRDSKACDAGGNTFGGSMSNAASLACERIAASIRARGSAPPIAQQPEVAAEPERALREAARRIVEFGYSRYEHAAQDQRWCRFCGNDPAVRPHKAMDDKPCPLGALETALAAFPAEQPAAPAKRTD